MELNHLVLSAKKLEPPVRTSDRDRVRHNLARNPSATDLSILCFLSFLQALLMPDERVACYKPG
jgi:hypothetical protein